MIQFKVHYFFILFIIILFSFLSCPGDLITEEDIIILEDHISPEITVFTPENNGYYGSTVLVDGNIKDLADSDGTPGKVKSLVYQVIGTATGGKVQFGNDGSFIFTFFAGDFEGEKTLTLTGTDWNRNRKTKRITLNKGAFHTFTCTPGNGQITLDWDTAAHVETYTLYYTDNGTTPSPSNGTSVNSVLPPYTIPDLTNGLLYSVIIRGNTGGQVDDWSGIEQTIPLSPLTLAPRIKGEYEKIHIAWTKIPGADYYTVLRSTSKTGPFTPLPGQQNNSYYTDTGIIQGQPYYYRIKPVLEGCTASEPVYGETSPFPPLASGIGSCQTDDFAYSVAVKGSHAYVTNHDNGLSVINISDPSSPRVVGDCEMPGNAYDVCIKDNYAYVAADNGGLCIVNISTPGNPVLTEVFTTDDYARALDVEGDYAYVAIDDSGLQIINISTPGNPQDVTSFPTGGTANGITVDGDYAYIASGDAGLVVVNISSPSNPVSAGSRDTPNMAYDVAVEGTLAYVADDSLEIQILNISTLSDITVAGSYNYPGPGGSRGIAISGMYAYVAHTAGGVLAVNISDPASPVKVDSYNSIGTANGVALRKEYGFVAAHNQGFHIISIAEPTPDESSSTGATTGDAKGVTVDGEYAYVAASGQGMVIFDISFPESPVLVDTIPTPGIAWDITVCGKYAFITGYNTGLEILDIANPTFVGYFSSTEIPDNTTGAELRGDYIYVSYWKETGETGVKVYNIADPSEPEEITSYTTDGYARDIAVYGDYAYIADDDQGTQIIDLTDDSIPPASANCGTSGNATGVAVWKNNVCIAEGYSGVQFIDITQPLFPVSLGIYNTPGFAYYSDGYGRYVFVADGLNGMYIIDKKQPGDPVYAGSYSILGVESQKIAVRGCYAYIAAGSAGLKIIDLWRYDDS